MPISETADKLLRSLVRVREPIDDYAAWDAELSTLAKADPDPLPLTMVKDGSTWEPAHLARDLSVSGLQRAL